MGGEGIGTKCVLMASLVTSSSQAITCDLQFLYLPYAPMTSTPQSSGLPQPRAINLTCQQPRRTHSRKGLQRKPTCPPACPSHSMPIGSKSPLQVWDPQLCFSSSYSQFLRNHLPRSTSVPSPFCSASACLRAFACVFSYVQLQLSYPQGWPSFRW